MNRPLFLTRTLPRLKRAALAVLVLSCFAFYGVLIALGV